MPSKAASLTPISCRLDSGNCAARFVDALLALAGNRRSSNVVHGWSIMRSDGLIASGYVSDNAPGVAADRKLERVLVDGSLGGGAFPIVIIGDNVRLGNFV